MNNKLSLLSRVVFLVQRFGEGQTNLARRLLTTRQVGIFNNIGESRISISYLKYSSANDRISSIFDTNHSSSTKLIVRSYAKKSKSKDSKQQQQSEKDEEKDDDENDDYDDDDDNEDKNAGIIKSIDTSDFKPGKLKKKIFIKVLLKVKIFKNYFKNN